MDFSEKAYSSNIVLIMMKAVSQLCVAGGLNKVYVELKFLVCRLPLSFHLQRLLIVLLVESKSYILFIIRSTSLLNEFVFLAKRPYFLDAGLLLNNHVQLPFLMCLIIECTVYVLDVFLSKRPQFLPFL